MIHLAMLRHGHTSWNRAGRIQGRTDIELDEDARIDLSSRRLPPPFDTAALVSSPLKRARETAELVGKRTPDTIDSLIEMNWGDWEGLIGHDLRADPASGYRDLEYWGWDFRPPNGETPADLWDRVAPWLSSLTTDTVAVCHIGTMRIIMARAYGWDFLGTPPFQIKRNRLYVVEISDGQLSPWNETPRLIETPL